MGHAISTYKPEEILKDYDFDISKEAFLKIYPHMAFYIVCADSKLLRDDYIYQASDTLHITITSVKCLHNPHDHYMRIEGYIVGDINSEIINLTDLYDCGEHIYNGRRTPDLSCNSKIKLKY
jgi:hypothetical protein